MLLWQHNPLYGRQSIPTAMVPLKLSGWLKSTLLPKVVPCQFLFRPWTERDRYAVVVCFYM
jgi:hypothetical protein